MLSHLIKTEVFQTASFKIDALKKHSMLSYLNQLANITTPEHENLTRPEYLFTALVCRSVLSILDRPKRNLSGHPRGIANWPSNRGDRLKEVKFTVNMTSDLIPGIC